MKELTKAEEQVMHNIWKLEKAFLKDIVEQFPEPRPAYTTVSTVIRVLVKKGFLKYNTYGKTNEYYASIKKHEYTRFFLKGVVKNFFNNSPSHLTSFFSDEEDVSLSELEEMKKIIDLQIQKRTQDE